MHPSVLKAVDVVEDPAEWDQDQQKGWQEHTLANLNMGCRAPSTLSMFQRLSILYLPKTNRQTYENISNLFVCSILFLQASFGSWQAPSFAMVESGCSVLHAYYLKPQGPKTKSECSAHQNRSTPKDCRSRMIWETDLLPSFDLVRHLHRAVNAVK